METYIYTNQLDLLEQGDRNLMQVALYTISLVKNLMVAHNIDTISIYKFVTVEKEFVTAEIEYKDIVLERSDLKQYSFNPDDEFKELYDVAESIYILCGDKNSVQIKINEKDIYIYFAKNKCERILVVPFNNNYSLHLSDRVKKSIHGRELYKKALKTNA